MKSRTLISTSTIALFTVLAISTQLAAQQHHHYKLIDMGTFGGPQSYVNEPPGNAPVLNNRGTVAGWADTPMSDPYSPNFCFNEDCFVSHAFRWQDGDVVDLSVLPDGSSSAANWISANGLIAGMSQNGQLDPLAPGFPEFRAVLWQNDRITDLGTLPEGGYESIANAVNSHGVVVGLATNTSPDSNSIFGLGYQTRAFRWDQEHGVQDLGTLGGTDAEALLVNEGGEIVGASYTDSHPSASCNQTLGLPLTTGTFLWKNGKMKDLGNFGGTCTFPIYLSDQGQVLGNSTLPGDKAIHPFLWPGKNGEIKDLGTLGGTLGAPWEINQRGEIAGWASTKGDQSDHAFLWKNDKMMDLGTVDGDQCSFGFGINSKSQVIGWSTDCALTAIRASLWEKGGPMVDLNALIPPNSSVHLETPETINDRGEIAGTGFDSNGDEHAFLLIPCDENHRDIEDCDYSLVEASAPVNATTTVPGASIYAATSPGLSPDAIRRLLQRAGLRSMPWRRRFGAQLQK